MARILIGWENGAGLGHVTRCRRVARALAARGHEPVLALRNIVEPAVVLKDDPFPVLQAPYWSIRSRGRKQPFSAHSFADILAYTGFADADDLFAMVEAWQRLIEFVRPDLVLGEYAPMLCLATFGTTPSVPFGNGFCVPPAHLREYPPLQEKGTLLMPQAAVLDVVREVQRRRGRPSPETLPAVMRGARRFPCTFPELDPYREVRREPCLPPLVSPPPPAPPPESPRFFAYLAGDLKWVPQVLNGLIRSGVPGGVYVRRPPRTLAEQLRKTRLTVYDSPPPLEDVLREASVVVHHASLGTAEAGLTMGRAQLVVPRDLEKTLIARSLSRLGVGLWVSRRTPVDEMARAVRQAAGDRAMGERATAVAAEIEARGPRRGVEAITDACEAILRGEEESPGAGDAAARPA